LQNLGLGTRKLAPHKLYAGAKLRELHGRIGCTQKTFAEKLGVSLPYLNQMENKNIVDAYQIEMHSQIGLPISPIAPKKWIFKVLHRLIISHHPVTSLA
jgi:transcriptional regulator with XRE-family HTH domain